MKVQVPSFEQWKKLWVEEGDERPHEELYVSYCSFCGGLNYANEQLASSTPTKRPFLSDEEIIQRTDQLHINSKSERMCFGVGATWARDKYEARGGGDVPGVEPAQTFYVIKRDEEPRYWNPGFGWQEKPMLTTSAGEHNRWKRDLDLNVLLPDNPTARIVTVRVEEINES